MRVGGRSMGVLRHSGAGVIVLACVALWSGTAAAAGSNVTGFRATPSELNPAGGPVQLSATVTGTVHCVFSASRALPGLPATVDCSSGSAQLSTTLPANAGTGPKTTTFTLTVKGPGKDAVATLKVVVDAPPPATVSLFQATPGTLPSTGGSVGLSATVADAASCTLSSSPAVTGLPVTVDCSSGSVADVVTLPANAKSNPKSYTFKLLAEGMGPRAKAASTVTVEPAGVSVPGVVHVTGTLTAGTTWSPAGASVYVADGVQVPAGVTLTIEPGTIVKIVNSGLRVTGVLQVDGIGAAPVTFTSIEDDSLGGDTNADGPSSGGSSDYYAGIDSDGQVTVAHTRFLHGAHSVLASGGSLNLSDSTLAASAVLDGATVLDLRRNIFAVADGQPAISANLPDLTGIVLGGADANSFIGPGPGRAIEVVGNVPAGKTWEIGSSTGGIVVPIGSFTVIGALRLEPGAIMKVANPIGITVPGSLEMNGTTANPAVLTSFKDDSAGGDTNGDGPSTGGPNDYAQGIVGTGNVAITHAELRDGQSIVFCGPGSFTMTDSSSSLALFAGSFGSFVCDPPMLDLRRNTFSTLFPPINAFGVDVSAIALAGPDANTFLGTGPSRVIVLDGATVPAGKSWDVSSAAGAVPVVYRDRFILKGTLTLDAGAIVKVDAPTGLDVEGGSVVAYGTAANHVVITSINDDSVGGDSFGDGPTSGAPGDYGTAISLAGAGASLVQAFLDIRFATTPIVQS